MANYPFYPATTPTVGDDGITVSMMLKQPTRINRFISDLAAVGMFSDKIFATGSAEGGAILYDVALQNAALADDHAAEIAPGGEYPIIGVSEGDPKVARVKKIGGRFRVTDEAQRRNDASAISRGAQRVANQVTFDIDQSGIKVLNDALTTYDSDIIKVESSGWVTMNKTEKGKATAAKSIRAELNKVAAEAAKLQLGYTYDTLILHPDDALEFSSGFDDDDKQDAFLRNRGLELIVSALATKGTGLLVAAHVVGSMGVEVPVNTRTYRDESRDLTWVQTSGSIAHAVTDPLAVAKLTGLGS